MLLSAKQTTRKLLEIIKPGKIKCASIGLALVLKVKIQKQNEVFSKEKFK